MDFYILLENKFMGKTTRFVLGFLGGFVGCITALKGLNYKLKIVEGECQPSPG